MLRVNQTKAIDISLKNDFQSGVHCHATGTGKSWIALELILAFNKKYPENNILWLCEQKSILIEQFNKKKIYEKGYKDIFNCFSILNYTEKKPRLWYQEINEAKFFRKPLLIIINRSFLVSKLKYEHITQSIDLIIHDECHSIVNNTTQTFYQWALKSQKSCKCIGFSATPVIDFKPYDKILSHYSIYDAFCDDIIVPPHIKWIASEKILTDADIISICEQEIANLYYKKIIVWCGMIQLCHKLALLWKSHFKKFIISVDTSLNNNNKDNQGFCGLEKFCEAESNAILFCACKHREGSDIKNLDGCIFLDKVEKRNSKTFVQCIGRVLRKDKLNKKQFGLILDLKASSCLKLCDRMNYYLNSKGHFPWKYTYYQKNNMIVNYLQLVNNKTSKPDKVSKNYTIKDVIDKFIIPCPTNEIYTTRLYQELEIIQQKKLAHYLIRAIEILELTNYIPHVTRGSSGSSLVCFLLGISNVDPIKYDIKFERFLNEYRDNLPDIDLDFPHYLRDEVFLKLELTWPNQVARISNHVNWHEKSAIREALRKIGIKKRIPKEDLNNFIKTALSPQQKKRVKQIQKELDNTFRHYSLHCGGIVFFHQGIPENIILQSGSETKTLSQIIYDKNDVSKHSKFKIDILSSRAISQLIGIWGTSIDFNNCLYDESTYTMLQNGNNIGITLAESPLMRKALLKIKPKTISDLAVCLAIIRPAAKDARIANNNIDFKTKFIFDDDAISILAENLNISNSLADKFRRCITKDKWSKETREHFDDLMSQLTKEKRKYISTTLQNLRKYSFCKSHSYSYAQLIYKLAYQKCHHPKEFWSSTLKHSCSSYRKWVHLFEARLAGVNVMEKITKERDVSIYAENRRKKFHGLTQEEQLRRFGYWDMTSVQFYPNSYFYEKEKGVYYFGGLIASLRILSIEFKKQTVVCCLGVGPGKYIEIITKGIYYNQKNIGLRGRAKRTDKTMNTYEAFIGKYY